MAGAIRRRDGSCSLPGSGDAITYKPGPPSPTPCTNNCGTLCVGFYCDPYPRGTPPEFGDPNDPKNQPGGGSDGGSGGDGSGGSGGGESGGGDGTITKPPLPPLMTSTTTTCEKTVTTRCIANPGLGGPPLCEEETVCATLPTITTAPCLSSVTVTRCHLGPGNAGTVCGTETTCVVFSTPTPKPPLSPTEVTDTPEPTDDGGGNGQSGSGRDNWQVGLYFVSLTLHFCSSWGHRGPS